MSKAELESAARKLITNDEPEDSPLIDFGVQLFELADELDSLEADIIAHDLGLRGLRKNGLAGLADRYDSLTRRWSSYQQALANPNEHFSSAAGLETEVSESDAGRLRDAHHSYGDFDQLLTQIRSTHDRLGRCVETKQRTRLTAWGHVISMVIATTALVQSSLSLSRVPPLL